MGIAVGWNWLGILGNEFLSASLLSSQPRCWSRYQGLKSLCWLSGVVVQLWTQKLHLQPLLSPQCVGWANIPWMVSCIRKLIYTHSGPAHDYLPSSAADQSDVQQKPLILKFPRRTIKPASNYKPVNWPVSWERGTLSRGPELWQHETNHSNNTATKY